MQQILCGEHYQNIKMRIIREGYYGKWHTVIYCCPKCENRVKIREECGEK